MRRATTGYGDVHSTIAHLVGIERLALGWFGALPMPRDEIIAKIEAVTVESVREAGRALVRRSRPAVAVLGPGTGLESAAAIAESLARRAA